jgi:hypothetical protein
VTAQANYVLVRNGDWTLSFSNLGAYEVAEVSILGPEITIRFLEAWAAMDRPSSWAPNAEGGLLVDADHRRVLIFTIYQSSSLQLAYTDAFARTWPGWELRWANAGIRELMVYVGLDAREDESPVHEPESDPDPARARTKLLMNTAEFWSFVIAEDAGTNFSQAYPPGARVPAGYWAAARAGVTRDELAAGLAKITGREGLRLRWPDSRRQLQAVLW